MNYVVTHEMSDLDRVKVVIEKAYDAYKMKLADYNPSLRWENDRRAKVEFTVMRKTIDANFAITDTEVRIEGSIPFLFRPFQGKIERVVGREVEKWLAKEKAGELE